MSEYRFLPKNRYFEVLGGMNSDNRGDQKVAMLSELDMSVCEKLRLSVQSTSGIKPSYTAIVAKAIALSLREHTYANRMALEWPFYKRILQLDTVHITVAVERDQPGVEQAVFAATLRNTDQADLADISRELHSIAQSTEANSERWRTVKRIVEYLPTGLARAVLRVPKYFPSLWMEHRGGAVMISSPAKYGVDMMVGHWPWPIGFSFGLVKERVLAIGGKPEVRPTMVLTMSFDRRLMGGAPAARFFKTVCDHIEEGSTLADSKE